MQSDSHVVNEDSLTKDGFQSDIRTYLQFPFGDATMSFAGVVDADNGGDSGESRFGGFNSLNRLAEKCPEVYANVVKEVEKVGSHFLDYVGGKDIKVSWRYLSDIILYRGDGPLQELIRILREYGRTRRSGMFGFSVELDHIHVIHDCAYSGGHCRDVWRKQVEPFGQLGPTRPENKPIWRLTRTDWYDVFEYFFLKKRGTRQIWIGGKDWKTPTDAELVRWEEEHRIGGQVVRSEDSGRDSVGSGQEYKRTSRAASLSDINEIYGKKPKTSGVYANIKSQTKALLLKYYCSPVSAIRDVREFRDNTLLSNPKNKDYLQSAFDDFGKDINGMKLREIFDMLSTGEPIFIMSMPYGDREESLDIIDRLVRFQCNDCEEDILNFLNSVVDVLDRKITKCNALAVISPPSSGKNFFFDMIFAICLNYGQLGQANKHNTFAFQEAPNKRVLVWNEPNYEKGLTDTIKMMMGGDPYTVRVKHGMDAHVRRTPVIILTNNLVPFLCDIAFRDRIVQFKWNAAPFLKDVEFKPTPLSFFDLLNKYNIKF
uniref:Non-structural protein 1 n=1 Tax=Phylloscopus inornatus ambidensovirus TaxID=2794452 RepID=A0A8E7G1M8_9VIRU|nr:MAG: non-structural protein 1 [Phylloscopus inornatus ambidensovirus]